MASKKRFILTMLSILLLSFGSCATTIIKEETVPKFSVEKVQPLIYAIGSVLGWGHAAELDAPRGSKADCLFADALLYEFLNDRNYDKSIKVRYDEKTYMNVMKAKDMLYLLRQYIGNYPKLINPPAGLFIFMNNDGDYIYGGSDKGFTDYKMTVDNVQHLGNSEFELKTSLFKLEYSEHEKASVAFVKKYSLTFKKADNSAYGYTIIKVASQ